MHARKITTFDPFAAAFATKNDHFSYALHFFVCLSEESAKVENNRALNFLAFAKKLGSILN